MSNTIIVEKYTSVIESVCFWLGYQQKIGREMLIHEASLRYPIADTITAKGIKINRVVLEKVHPLFKSKKIDMVIYDDSVEEPEAERDDRKLREVYEFKLSKRSTSILHGDEHQRVFDDIVRLAYYHLWSKKECYFLMCGKYDEFYTYFVGQQEPPKSQGGRIVVQPQTRDAQNGNHHQSTDVSDKQGLYDNWFGFNINESKTIQFEKNEIWGLKSFQKNYKLRYPKRTRYSNSIKVKTTCLAITPSGEKSRTHAAGIWRIEAINPVIAVDDEA